MAVYHINQPVIGGKQVIIGLTGLYCAGKNYIASILEKRGLPVLDVDKLGHRAIETRKKEILERFGNDILGTDNAINRKLLGEIVFGKPAELAALEAIIHPEVNRLTDDWIAGQRGSACVINAALLHRSSAFTGLDALIVVHASFIVRLLRARKRDALPWPDLLKRLRSQKNFTSQYLFRKADIYRVENPGFFRLGFRRKPEDRIDEILSSLKCNIRCETWNKKN